MKKANLAMHILFALMFTMGITLLSASNVKAAGDNQVRLAQAGGDEFGSEGEGEEEDAFGNIMHTSYIKIKSVDFAAPAAGQPCKVTVNTEMVGAEDEEEAPKIVGGKIWYITDGGMASKASAALSCSGSSCTGEIPGQANGTKVSFAVALADSFGNTTVQGLPASNAGDAEAALIPGTADMDNSKDIVPDDMDLLDLAASFDSDRIYVSYSVQGKISGGTIEPPYIQLYGIKISNPDVEQNEGLMVGKLWINLPLAKDPTVQQKFMPLLTQAKEYTDKINKDDFQKVLDTGMLVLDIGKLMSGNIMEGLLFSAKAEGRTVGDNTFVGSIKRAAVGNNPSGFVRIIMLTAANASIDSFMPIPLNCSHFMQLYFTNQSYTSGAAGAAVASSQPLSAPIAAGPPKDFPDLPDGHWAKDAVDRLSSLGLVEGYKDGTYGGSRPMTRYEYAQIVSRLMDYIGRTYCTPDNCKTEKVVIDDNGKEIDLSNYITKAQFEEAKATLEKLAAEFKDELAALKAQVATNTADIDKINKRLDKLTLARINVTGAIRQRMDVLDTDLNTTLLAALLTDVHGITGVTSLNAGYEMVPSLLLDDAIKDDDVSFSVGLKKHINNQGALGPIAQTTNETMLDIDHAYVALDFTKDVRELDLLKLTSGYQKVEFGPYGLLVDNRGLDSNMGVRLDVGKDVVSFTGFGGMFSMSGNGAASGVGSGNKDPYAAVRMGINLNYANIGLNYLANGVGSEKGWGVDVSAKLLKNSPFLKAIRAEFLQMTDSVSGLDVNSSAYSNRTGITGADDNSVIVGLDVYKSTHAGLTVSYANIPALPVLSGADGSPLTEYDTGCPMGLDIKDDTGMNRCINFESGNVLFPGGFKGLGFEASYIVLGDVELAAKGIAGDFAGGRFPTASLGTGSTKGLTYPGYGSVSVTKPINKTSKFRLEYFQQGLDTVLINRFRGELLISF